ncbi:MAG: hypothetical protein A2Y24_06070 [Clostridiales bacterium GWE2_32_10]|nr:MAG: hypothetical protein A2Y24_06070 [Clostridiales bacterium GWE2_32_10]HBY21550.1 hypothetical protein [Clostridiales bacterium]
MDIDINAYDKEVLPSDIKIKSFAANANILCNIKDKGLMLLNYPDIYNMLFPFYSTNIDSTISNQTKLMT